MLAERTWLKEKRQRLSLTQDAIAERIGITRASYAHFETGRRTPAPRVAKRLAETMGFDWDIFFAE
ncbi:DNA-binding XRE family transcriptional regulator [Paenibacillus cellulosilyticus]|uniref:DNA-binding XRE family transcriptional regulator n=1 Tax=Paenibacillus cellulosilyticus TaxID=375489 RepID=A0A2V2YHE4_9BACL|nr:helix-turn-helix transcriptional regulator [Paenibacillus cellulosilyticus]PWV92010.1 DNA-binding XRE family transcriptional regulator [Paenibacillus cellulosilyticus]